MIEGGSPTKSKRTEEKPSYMQFKTGKKKKNKKRKQKQKDNEGNQIHKMSLNGEVPEKGLNDQFTLANNRSQIDTQPTLSSEKLGISVTFLHF